MVEDPHEPDQVEGFGQTREVVNLHPAKFHLSRQSHFGRRPTRLGEVMVVHVDAEDRCAPLGELEGVKTRVAADVQHAPAGEIGGDEVGDEGPLVGREITPDERVRRQGLGAVRQVEVVKPGRERVDFLLERHTGAR